MWFAVALKKASLKIAIEAIIFFLTLFAPPFPAKLTRIGTESAITLIYVLSTGSLRFTLFLNMRPSQLNERSPFHLDGGRRFVRDACGPQRRAIQAGKIAFHGLSHGHYPGKMLPLRVLPGLSHIGFWDAIGTQDWGMDFHRNEGIEIVLLETGRMDFHLEKMTHRLHAGSLTVTRPWQLHCHGIPHVGPGRLHWLILDVHALSPGQKWKWPDWIVLTRADLKELTRKLHRDRDSVFQASPDMLNAFRKLAECLVQADYQKQISAIILSINQLLLSLLSASESPRIAKKAIRVFSEQAVEQFLNKLKDNPILLTESWTLEAMARRCGVGATALVKYCHELTNTTPMDYLNRCRLAWSIEQLKRKDVGTITDVAFQAGFSSSPYFATLFRRRYGMSPSQYRLMHGTKKENSKSATI
jgi:AraC-like DNA-binding protein